VIQFIILLEPVAVAVVAVKEDKVEPEDLVAQVEEALFASLSGITVSMDIFRIAH
jgi:hypothetical protein